MCAAWNRKNERNEIVCFYCTLSGILCGITRFTQRNNNKLRTFQPQKWRKLRTASLKQNLLVPTNKRVYHKTKTKPNQFSVFFMLTKDKLCCHSIVRCSKKLFFDFYKCFLLFMQKIDPRLEGLQLLSLKSL